MRTITITILCLAASLAVSARTDSTAVNIQNDSNEAKHRWFTPNIQNDTNGVAKPKLFTPYGFIRTDCYAQERKMESVVQELMPFYPSPSAVNKYGEDANKVASVGFYSMTSRLGLKIQTNGVKGTKKIGGCVEADFTAGTNCTQFYLRKAFVQVFWKRSNLLIGQTWHPLCTENMMPNTLSINVGAPYNPFSRNPQLRYTYHLVNKNDQILFDLTAAIVYQASSCSAGPDASDSNVQISSNKFQKDALIPNAYIGAEHTIRHWMMGIGFDYKALNPIKTYTNFEGQQKINNHLLHTMSLMAYCNYKRDMIDISAKAIYGSNLSEHKLIGGYAVGKRLITIDGVSGYVYDFVPYTTLSSYLNISCGRQFKGNLFCGASVILNPEKELNDSYTFYGTGKSGDQFTKYCYRVGVSFTYSVRHWLFGLEAQYNKVEWGTYSLGRFGNYSKTGGHWLDAAVIYSF